MITWQVKSKIVGASADSQPPKAKCLSKRLDQALDFISRIQTQLITLRDRRNRTEALEKSNAEEADLRRDLEYWRKTETNLRKELTDHDKKKTSMIATYDECKKASREEEFERPTPKPEHGTFRTSFTCWPGGKPVADRLPTREEIVTDKRDYVLGIGNGFGTGKTELALEGKLWNVV